jgi:mono/diheme cytochrome c family protein
MKTFFLTAIVLATFSFFSFQQKQKFDLKQSIKRGADVYLVQCLQCHQENGEGLEGVYPPLAKSDYMMADKKRSITQTLKGLTGEIKVNGKIYNGEMAAFETLTDEEISDVLNYVRNSWGNKSAAVIPTEVKVLRK